MPKDDDRYALQIRAALEILRDATRWIGGRKLARKLGLTSARRLRDTVIWPMRARYRIPVHSRPGPRGGYKLAVSAEEHKECVTWAEQMGRDFLAIYSILRCESLDIVAGQMAFEFFPLATRPKARQDALGMLIEAEARRGRRATWLSVVDRLLEIMAENPDVYAEQIDHVRRRFGGLFLDQQQAAALREHLDAAARLLTTGQKGRPFTPCEDSLPRCEAQAAPIPSSRASSAEPGPHDSNPPPTPPRP